MIPPSNLIREDVDLKILLFIHNLFSFLWILLTVSSWSQILMFASNQCNTCDFFASNKVLDKMFFKH